MAGAAGRTSIKLKILGIVLLSVLLADIALGYFSFQFSKERLVVMLGDSIKGIASTIASFVSPEDIALILKESEKIKQGSPNTASRHVGFSQVAPSEFTPPTPLPETVKEIFRQYSAQLERIRAVHGIDSPITIYVSTGARLFAVVTSDQSFLIGNTYVMRSEAKKAFKTDTAVATNIYKDKDGIWISAYAPGASLPLENKRIIVEVNYRINAYLSALQKELLIIVIICVIGFFAVAFLSYYLVTTLVSSIKKLDQAIVALEQERYDKIIDVRTDDEIGHLARAFELLRRSIKNKIEELRLSLHREKKAHLESLVALTNAIETRDPYTKEHVSRVQEYALLIAKAMHLPHDDMIQLRYSCILHDIGKIYIEDALLKKGKLTFEDFEEIKKHSERGAKIIEGIQFLTDVKEAVLYHQERYDGTGYPRGLKGTDIPILARIVAVADAFDAMTTDRPYRAKMPFKAAIDEIEKNIGIQFDPDIARAFLKYRDTIEKMANDRFGASA